MGAGAAKPTGTRTILLVEDDESVRALVRRALGARYEVVEAVDGMEASERIASMSSLPALVVCDVMMPRVDGFSFARMLKANEKTKGVPILFLTAKTAPADVLRGLTLGARHYMTKPFKMQDLLDMVDKIVGR